MDTLVLKGMKFHAFHGYHDHEKKEGNEFEVDVILKADLSTPALSDSLEDTIDYSKIHAVVKEIMESESVNLIEHLAQKILIRISENYKHVQKIEVRLRKINPPLDGRTDFTEVRMSWPRS